MHKLKPPYRALVISDASHASSKTVYAKEGQLVLLTTDEASQRHPTTAAYMSASQQRSAIRTNATLVLQLQKVQQS